MRRVERWVVRARSPNSACSSQVGNEEANMTRSPGNWCQLFYPFFGWEGSPTKIDKTEKVGTLILTSLLEDLEGLPVCCFLV